MAKRLTSRTKSARQETSLSLTTYGVRLDEAERSLLAKALKVRGWTPTHFIRQSTLEKAAQVDNTSKFTTFDFDLLARRIAKQLCDVEPRFGSQEGPASGTCSFEELQDGNPNLRATYCMEECDRIVKSPTELPSPIDPSQFA